MNPIHSWDVQTSYERKWRSNGSPVVERGGSGREGNCIVKGKRDQRSGDSTTKSSVGGSGKVQQLEPDLSQMMGYTSVSTCALGRKGALRNTDMTPPQIKGRKDRQCIFSLHNRMLSYHGTVRIEGPDSCPEERLRALVLESRCLGAHPTSTIS